LLVTFGTVFGGPQLLGPILRALSRAGAGLRVTLGLTGSAGDFDLDLDPELVSFEQFRPFHELLDGVDLVVAHGGAGTTLGSLAEGLPLVLLPQAADQFLNADRAAAAGAAIALKPDSASPAAIVAAVRLMLDEPGYRRAARRIADQIAAMPAPDEVANELAAKLA